MANFMKADNPSNERQFMELLKHQLDITGAEGVEVMTTSNPTGGVLWVNVNGICVLRVCNIKALSINGVGKP